MFVIGGWLAASGRRNWNRLKHKGINVAHRIETRSIRDSRTAPCIALPSGSFPHGCKTAASSQGNMLPVQIQRESNHIRFMQSENSDPERPRSSFLDSSGQNWVECWIEVIPEQLDSYGAGINHSGASLELRSLAKCYCPPPSRDGNQHEHALWMCSPAVKHENQQN